MAAKTRKERKEDGKTRSGKADFEISAFLSDFRGAEIFCGVR
jgi:hypothetical protein